MAQLLPLRGGLARGPLLIPPLAAGASLPGARVRPGSRGSLPLASQPGRDGGGRSVSRPSGGVARGLGDGGACCLRPSLCPPPAGNIAGVTGDARAMGLRPPYCSGLCAAPRRGPCAGLVRWCGFACPPRPPRGQAVGGAGARRVQVRLRPPPGCPGPFWGRGDAPSAAGGVEGRLPVARKPGRSGGGRAAVSFSSALGGGLWPPTLSPTLYGAPPLFIQGLLGGHRRRARSGRPSVVQCGGGGRGFLAMTCPPAFPRRASRRAASSAYLRAHTVLLRPTASAESRRPAAGYAGVSGRPTGGA